MKEKLRLNCGVTAVLCTPHSRVPSLMIGQYTLDSGTNSIRDTSVRLGKAFGRRDKKVLKSLNGAYLKFC